MRIRNLLIGAASVVVLAVTHWFAYNCGVEYAITQDAPLREYLRADEPFDVLLCNVPVLNAALKCPEDFPKEDIQKWRQETEAMLAVAETTSLDFFEQTGNEGREKIVRRTINEARSLLAKLPE